MNGWVKISYCWGSSVMPAHVYGDWAVHRSPDWPLRGWRVTHKPTGYGTWVLADGMTKSDAIRIARLLSERVPELRMRPMKASKPDMAPVRVHDEDHRLTEATFAEVLGR